MQAYPELAKRPAAAFSAAKLISASYITINGSLPPSSKVHFFIYLPAKAATFLPA